MHQTLRLVLQRVQLGRLFKLNRTFVRQCLLNLLKLLLWIRRRCGLLKGLSDGKSSCTIKDEVGTSPGLPYEKETPHSGIGSAGDQGPEEIQKIYEARSPIASYLSTSSAVPGMVGVTDAIAYLVDPSSSRLSLQGPANDSQVPDEPQQDIPGPPGPRPDSQDVLLSPECQTLFESRSFSHPTLRPFVPEQLGRYERNVKM